MEFVPAIDAVFERLGKKREDYIDLWPCEPMYFFRTPEGTYLDIAKDINEKYKFIKSCSLEDAEDWLKYCDC